MDSYLFVKKNSDGSFDVRGHAYDPYLYIEHPEDTLRIWWPLPTPVSLVKPIMWVQEGRYGWISKEQVQNMVCRQIDLTKQQKGDARNKPLDLAFHWDDRVTVFPYEK